MICCPFLDTSVVLLSSFIGRIDAVRLDPLEPPL